MKKIVIIVLFSLLLLGCQKEEPSAVNSKTFFDYTTIESHLFNAEFMVASTNETFEDNYTIDPLYYVECDRLEQGLKQVDSFAFDEITIIDSFSEDDDVRYYIVPIYNTWQINDYTVSYTYDNNQLTVLITLIPSNYPATDIKLLIFSINSAYDYDIVFAINN